MVKRSSRQNATTTIVNYTTCDWACHLHTGWWGKHTHTSSGNTATCNKYYLGCSWGVSTRGLGIIREWFVVMLRSSGHLSGPKGIWSGWRLRIVDVLAARWWNQVILSLRIKLDENNILYIIIPPNTTNRLQPLDVSVNKPAKDFVKKLFQTWYAGIFCKQLQDKIDEPVDVTLHHEAFNSTVDQWNVLLFLAKTSY